MTSLAFDLPQEDGRACAVRVAAPPGLMPAGGWPVAYVLDIKQFDRMRADPGGLPGLLVGLGPGVPEDRRWDYVPAGMSPDMGQSLRVAPSLTNPNRLQAVRWADGRGADDAGEVPPGLRAGAARWLSSHASISRFRNRHCRPTRTAGIFPALISRYTVRRLT